MTGKELIIYILQNNLENEPVFKDGKFIGFLTVGEAATKCGVGAATILTLANRGMIDAVVCDQTICIPANATLPTKGELHDQNGK